MTNMTNRHVHHLPVISTSQKVGPPCALWCTRQVVGAQRRSMMHDVALCTIEVVHNVASTNPARWTDRRRPQGPFNKHC